MMLEKQLRQKKRTFPPKVKSPFDTAVKTGVALILAFITVLYGPAIIEAPFVKDMGTTVKTLPNDISADFVNISLDVSERQQSTVEQYGSSGTNTPKKKAELKFK